MDNRRKIADAFCIEDHAALFGMLAKSADQLYGVQGDMASAYAVGLYARERGKRMRLRAQEDGMALTLETYRIYTEWEDSEKRMKVETINLGPSYRMNGTYCVWNETWKKLHLEKYGRIYCSIVDQTMVKSFNPENELRIYSTLSQDGTGCDFEWVGLCYASKDALLKALLNKQALRQRTIKDFLFHCGHMLSAMNRGYEEKFGAEPARQIIALAMEKYLSSFGEEKTNAVLEEAKLDFQAI